MIYNPNSRVELFGEEADMFLAECGISLYDDHIVLEGEQAEEYKKRKAAEKEEKELEYKRQAQRRYPNPTNNWKDNYGKQYTRRNPSEQRDTDDAFNGDEKAMDRWQDRKDDDSRRQSAAANMANKDYYSGKRPMNSDQNVRAIDAADRHMRRHPKQYKESSIFDNLKLI